MRKAASSVYWVRIARSRRTHDWKWDQGVHSGRRSDAVRLGAFLPAELVEPLQLRNRLAAALKCRRINEIVHGRSAISADRALRLARYFAVSDWYFLRLQENCDLRVARREPAGEAGADHAEGGSVDFSRAFLGSADPL